VSFQGNKSRAQYRWYKYKEAFSAELVEALLAQYQLQAGPILDPFAGMGTTLFCARELGAASVGIEVLPIGCELIRTRLLLNERLADLDRHRLHYWLELKPWLTSVHRLALPTLKITAGAYPFDTVNALERYLGAAQQESVTVQAVLRFALLCIVESISYTRKDGQYLRWDHRSGRRQGTKVFDKGPIRNFTTAISEKIHDILHDSTAVPPADLFSQPIAPGALQLIEGSCLNVLPTLAANSFRGVFTSPPYCNRYDYTRTYALELALLGVNQETLCAYRQAMLSCTVENRAKDLLALNPRWQSAIQFADQQKLLQAILEYFDQLKQSGALNNLGIPRMVRGYFYEMTCVIADCARVLQPGGRLIMVNDNVRYAGISIPVDLILSDLAEQLGLHVDTILVLPSGKGNSSQQMGVHGRDALRKCIYVWSKH
jgi:DNA modification methylase